EKRRLQQPTKQQQQGSARRRPTLLPEQSWSPSPKREPELQVSPIGGLRSARGPERTPAEYAGRLPAKEFASVSDRWRQIHDVARCVQSRPVFPRVRLRSDQRRQSQSSEAAEVRGRPPAAPPIRKPTERV